MHTTTEWLTYPRISCYGIVAEMNIGWELNNYFALNMHCDNTIIGPHFPDDRELVFELCKTEYGTSVIRFRCLGKVVSETDDRPMRAVFSDPPPREILEYYQPRGYKVSYVLRGIPKSMMHLFGVPEGTSPESLSECGTGSIGDFRGIDFSRFSDDDVEFLSARHICQANRRLRPEMQSWLDHYTLAKALEYRIRLELAIATIDKDYNDRFFECDFCTCMYKHRNGRKYGTFSSPLVMSYVANIPGNLFPARFGDLGVRCDEGLGEIADGIWSNNHSSDITPCYHFEMIIRQDFEKKRSQLQRYINSRRRMAFASQMADPRSRFYQGKNKDVLLIMLNSIWPL